MKKKLPYPKQLLRKHNATEIKHNEFLIAVKNSMNACPALAYLRECLDLDTSSPAEFSYRFDQSF